MSRAFGKVEAILFSVGLSLLAIPAQARFLQTDPIGTQDQMNLYNYCGNNPMGCTDPTGLRTKYHGTTADNAVENKIWINSLKIGGIQNPSAKPNDAWAGAQNHKIRNATTFNHDQSLLRNISIRNFALQIN